MNYIAFNDLIRNTPFQVSIEEQIKESMLPFVIWGIGSLSYSIKKYMDYLGIKINCYWVDGECKLKEKEGIPILSLAEIKAKYEKINVIFGHSKYELKKELKEKCGNIQNVFCVPNVCYNRFTKIDLKFFEKNSERYFHSFSLLDDKVSQKCMIAYLQCKLSENVDYIIDIFDGELNYFRNPCFFLGKEEVYVDVGAYTGDTIELFLKETGYKYKKIFAFEPEEENFTVLKKYVEEKGLENVIVQKVAIWNKKEKLSFDLDKESSGISSDNDKKQALEIEANTLDSLLENEQVTLVKINFLTGVNESLEGMRKIMNLYKPRLAITVGFDEYALLTIPEVIKQINPAYKLYLRFAAAMPARLLLFAV